MTTGSIGDQELALLRFVADRGGATVGEAVDGFGEPRDLARSTVLTMMERLRRKGHLARKSVNGVYRYQTRVSSAELLRGVVRRFVEGNLGGSVAPFVAYLSESTDVTADELRQLEEAVARLQSRTSKEPQR
jgi:predicted transcriptional regulator